MTLHLWQFIRPISSIAARSATKTCKTCGRIITWRKKWEKNWADILYCSDNCRSNRPKPNSLDLQFETTILSLLHERRERTNVSVKSKHAVQHVTCEEAEAITLERYHRDPSQMNIDHIGTRLSKVINELKIPKNTRERCRQAARRLADRGEVVVMQNGKVVDPSFARGTLEIGLKP